MEILSVTLSNFVLLFTRCLGDFIRLASYLSQVLHLSHVHPLMACHRRWMHTYRERSYTELEDYLSSQCLPCCKDNSIDVDNLLHGVSITKQNMSKYRVLDSNTAKGLKIIERSHRITKQWEFEVTSGDHLVHSPCVAVTHCMMPRWFWNLSRGEDSRTSLANLLQCCVTLTGKKLFLMLRWNLLVPVCAC